MEPIGTGHKCDLAASKQNKKIVIFGMTIPLLLRKNIPFHVDSSSIESPRCGCVKKLTPTKKPLRGHPLKTCFARLFSLCFICCAAPLILVTAGVVSVSTGAYLGRILEATLIFGLLMLVSYLLWRYYRSRQAG